MPYDLSRKYRCIVCDTEIAQDQQYAYLSGYYCSSECYDTLFDTCNNCRRKNMTVRQNLKYHNEKLCDRCRHEKHGLSVVTIVCR